MALAARGWSVIPVHHASAHRCSCGRDPCPSPGKHPKVRWERWMGRRATPTEIEAWWERWPDANVGIVTGWISSILVLDVDPRHGGDASLAALESEHGRLPETVTCMSGGGGRHLYFAHPTHLVPSRQLGAGLDLKAEGGMVVAPPSCHVSGDVYRWMDGHAPGEHDLGALPSWLEEISITVDEPWNAGPRDSTPRTAGEKETFSWLWSEVGVQVSTKEYMALCPFHDDHHPSLHIDPVGCQWFCFGCRRGGGIQALGRAVHPEKDWPPPRLVDPSDVTTTPTLLPDHRVDVIGESAYQEELLALTGGRRTWAGARRRVLAHLEPEDVNPADPDAVVVTIEGLVVGHLTRRDAPHYRPVVQASIGENGSATCLAEIRGGWERDHGDVGRFGVILFLPMLEPDPTD